MKAVLQRVTSASVVVEGKTIGAIQRGILVLLGVARGDESADVEWMARKISEIRMFDDSDSKMNLSVVDVKGSVLVVSQFTLCADCSKGRRPGFHLAAEPAIAEQLYLEVVKNLRGKGIQVETGKFAAMMAVSLVNDGPVTFLLNSRAPQEGECL